MPHADEWSMVGQLGIHILDRPAGPAYEAVQQELGPMLDEVLHSTNLEGKRKSQNHQDHCTSSP